MNKPLFLHRNGQWCKKIGGKLWYFGTDYEKAIKRLKREFPSLVARRRRVDDSQDGATLAQLANLYHAAQTERISQGRLSQRTLDEATGSIRHLLGVLGSGCVGSSLKPSDFALVMESLYKPRQKPQGMQGGRSVEKRSPITVDGDVRRIKAFLRWCVRSKHLATVDYGDEFAESPQRVKRLSKGEKHIFAPSEIHKVIDAARVNFRPLIWLAINGGMGARDIAQLTVSQVLCDEWLDCPRQKTGVARRVWLWPETRSAIDAWLDVRPDSMSGVAFLTNRRLPFVRGNTDSASQMFRKYRKSAGLAAGSFYDLRRTFQTIADQTLDFPAVASVMGHASQSGDMSAVYREISDDRVKAVCESVREWMTG